MVKSIESKDNAYTKLVNGKNAIAVTLDAAKSLAVPAINKWGHFDNIAQADATLGQVVWPVLATTQQYKFLFSPASGLNIQSTNINDTNSSGTGARTVEIIYHDENNNQQSITVALNGTTPVPLGFQTLGIFRMKVVTSGSGHVNAGDINVTDSGGDILCKIRSIEGQTQIAVQKVPAGMQGVCTYHNVYFPGGNFVNTATMRLRVKRIDGTINTKWEPELTQFNVMDERRYLTGGITVNAGEWIYWECIATGANGITVSGSFDIDFFELEV